MYKNLRKKNGGEGGIRTHGTFPYNGFQDRHLQPLGHLSITFANYTRYFFFCQMFNFEILSFNIFKCIFFLLLGRVDKVFFIKKFL